MKKYINVRGKQIYVETHGADHLPKLLYLHGGPGSGCCDFTYFQSSILSKSIQLITLDQRGIGRSEELAETDDLALDDLVDDCEEIRKQLGINSWSVLGHSFGAMLVVLYATKYSDSLDKLIFECPTFDLELSAKSLLKGAFHEYEKKQNRVMMERCLEYIHGNQSSKETWSMLMDLMNELGEDRENLYYKNTSPDVFNKIYREAYDSPNEMWEKQGLFQRKLYQDERLFESFLPLLEKIVHPALLIKGKYDWVASDDQVESFLKAVPYASFKQFENSGHFPHIEEKDEFAEAVSQFLNR
ncbi:alpha/beta fold hydrolase [Heyndrickxia shackletonii]|uniref:alpha/beta fold hydrolase n=1 Tax=Heyndrickxia shackletonii TaxID=157838 RepID=UPI0006EC0FAC|nr:alpha/beta hydrolase [Heyndrickxia shackletonii]MBB2482610.1 alpha/beta hydrolase [Bacillus sp. APMAM]NEZ00169.1 alpha/beta hydrolase [Heyndrickxia shackletonii]